MEPSPEGIVSALLKRDYSALLQAALVFAVVHYGAYLIVFLRGKYLELVQMGREAASKISFLAKTTIDDRFFDLLEKAVSNQVHLDTALANAAADGQINQMDLPKITEAVLSDMKANTGVPDLMSFALAIFGSTREVNSDGTASPALNNAIKAKIQANLPRALGEIGTRVGERRLERQIKARGLLQPPSVP